jgi:hypothetical protein
MLDEYRHWLADTYDLTPPAEAAADLDGTFVAVFPAVLMNGLGIETGIDIDLVVDAGQFISLHLGRKAASRAGNAIAAKRAQ